MSNKAKIRQAREDKRLDLLRDGHRPYFWADLFLRMARGDAETARRMNDWQREVFFKSAHANIERAKHARNNVRASLDFFRKYPPQGGCNA